MNSIYSIIEYVKRECRKKCIIRLLIRKQSNKRTLYEWILKWTKKTVTACKLWSKKTIQTSETGRRGLAFYANSTLHSSLFSNPYDSLPTLPILICSQSGQATIFYTYTHVKQKQKKKKQINQIRILHLLCLKKATRPTPFNCILNPSLPFPSRYI